MHAPSIRTPPTTPSTNRARTRVSLVLGAILGGALFAAPAHAAEPVDAGGAYVLDEAGVLGDDAPRVEAALESLFDEIGAPLIVVLVDTFEAPRSGADWAEAAAIASGLGERDALLAIAVDDRAFGVAPGAEFPVGDAALASAETDALIPALRDDRWADGIVAYAERLAAPQGSIVPFLIGAAIVGGIIVIIVVVVRSRRRGTGTARAPEKQSLEQIDQTAARRLVELDDALATSEQELGFAEAQFGAEPTAGFRDALTRARAIVTEAFRSRRALDEGTAEAGPRREALLRIVAQCDEADALLAAQEEAFEALREVEQNLSGSITTARGALDGAASAVETARTTVDRLREEYAAAALSDIADAPEQLPRLLQLAEDELQAALAAHERQEPSAAAIEVRSAQLVLAQLHSTAEAVERRSAELADARTAVAAQRTDLASGLEAARAIPPTTARSPELAAAVAAAQSALDEVDDRDPVASLTRLVAADRALDAELADAREESERRASAEAALERTLASARSAILSAAEYIASHRGAVGAGARGRLAEAQAQLEVAVNARTTDPVSALQTAQGAHELAQRALDDAERDVRGALEPRGALGGLSRAGSTGGGGALVGGLLGGLIGSGGAPSRPRFGSSGSRRSTSSRSSRSPARPARSSRSRSGRSRGGRF
ncbi:MAG: TPM domain-containing protein [Microcella sp.]|uniref:TPM domain-containing protein n=1 Tax=Microcella sp. TaxID=1913979 RepID=UPI0033160EAB